MATIGSLVLHGGSMRLLPSMQFAAGLGIVLVILLGLAVLPAPPDDLLWSAILDAGHVPLFGVVAYLVLRLSLASFGSAKGRAWHYLVAFAVSAAVGLVTEGVQIFVARDANLMDQARNLLGAAAALLAVGAADRRSPGLRAGQRHVLRGLAAILVGVAWWPPASTAVACLQRNAAFPSLCSFEHGWERRFVRLRDSALEVMDPPASWPAEGKVGRLTFQPAGYPAFALRSIVRDWSAYDRLAFEVFSSADTTLTMFVRIDDAEATESYQDRFNRALRIEPGVNGVRIPLAEVVEGPRGRRMDLKRMESIAFFAHRPPQPLSLYVDAFRLEQSSPP